MRATVHQRKNEEQCQRVLQNVHMDRSRMIFLTVQSQIQRLRADVLYGSARTSGLDRTPLGEGADYLIRTFHFNCSPRCTAHRFCVMSRWKISTTSKTRRCLGRSAELLISSRPQSIVSSATSPGEQVVVRVEHLPMTHNGSTSHRSTKDVREPEHTSRPAQRIGSSSFRRTTTLTDTRNARKRHANNIHLVSQSMPKYPLKGDGLFSDQEKKNNWYGSLSYKLHGRCYSVGAAMIYIFAERGHPVFRCSSPM